MVYSNSFKSGRLSIRFTSCKYFLYVDSNVKNATTTNKTLAHSNINSLSMSTQMDPSSAVRSIISSFIIDGRVSSPQQPAKSNSRIRPERQFGEVITNGNLLQELKNKEQAKKNKQQNRKVKK
jgi:hypothetical protein